MGTDEKATSWSFPFLTSLIIDRLHHIPFHTPHLTRFRFSGQDGTASTDKLVSFLENCPLLEHINVIHTDLHQTEHDLVSLPRLRTYTEGTFCEACTLAVLNVLSLPPSVPSH